MTFRRGCCDAMSVPREVSTLGSSGICSSAATNCGRINETSLRDYARRTALFALPSNRAFWRLICEEIWTLN